MVGVLPVVYCGTLAQVLSVCAHARTMLKRDALDIFWYELQGIDSRLSGSRFWHSIELRGGLHKTRGARQGVRHFHGMSILYTETRSTSPSFKHPFTKHAYKTP
jgi:hypothetical protein